MPMHRVRITVGVVGGASRTVTQRVFDVQGDQKINALQEILREIPGLTVIFTETKRNADMLEHALIMQSAFILQPITVVSGAAWSCLQKLMVDGTEC
jgi:superfamily II DNA/RNA helicase